MPAMKLGWIVIALLIAEISATDKPCKARKIEGQSIVCVCNATYCDEFTRLPPAYNQYVTYTSSEAGSRFLKATNSFKGNGAGKSAITLTLDPTKKYQTVEGFGGAVTDSASINWKSLSDPKLEQYLIDSYFGNKGLQYNMMRVPIGGCDFSTHPYAYNELPRGDVQLQNFSLATEDYKYKIPMIKSALEAAEGGDPIHIVASTWSPPLWMKTNEVWGDMSQLKPEYYQTYADYFVQFVQKYADNDINVWGITTTNEPINGMLGSASFNSLGWSPLKMGKWISENLGPTVRSSAFPDLQILTMDDQRASIPWWFNVMVELYPEALKYINGVAVHFYTDFIIPAAILDLITDTHPDKFIISTEACEGALPWEEKVLLGSWDRAKNYVKDIIDDLNHNVVGWIDWNLCLDAEGGPNWVKNFVDSPIIVLPENKEFVKQPMFYALGHFSKFVPRGSRRIHVDESKSFWTSNIEKVAFVTPRDTVVVVMYNDGNRKDVTIELGKKKAFMKLEARSVVTVELAYNAIIDNIPPCDEDKCN